MAEELTASCGRPTPALGALIRRPSGSDLTWQVCRSSPACHPSRTRHSATRPGERIKACGNYRPRNSYLGVIPAPESGDVRSIPAVPTCRSAGIEREVAIFPKGDTQKEQSTIKERYP